MIDKEIEYKALKACLSQNHCIDSCPLWDQCVGEKRNNTARLDRLLELHGEMVARKIAEADAEIIDANGVSYIGFREMLDIAKSVGKE